MNDARGSEDGGGRATKGGKENTPSDGSATSLDGDVEIDHSLFEGSSSEDEAAESPSRSSCRDDGGGGVPPYFAEQEAGGIKQGLGASPPGTGEIDHELFDGSDSDEEEVEHNTAAPSVESVDVSASSAVTSCLMGSSAGEDASEGARHSCNPFSTRSHTLSVLSKEVLKARGHDGVSGGENAGEASNTKAPLKRKLPATGDPQDTGRQRDVSSGSAPKRACIPTKFTTEECPAKGVVGSNARESMMRPLSKPAILSDGPKSTAPTSVPRRKAGNRQASSSVSSVWKKMKQSAMQGQITKISGTTTAPGDNKRAVSPTTAHVGGGATRRRPTTFHPKVELEQYWRSIRNWDFVPALNQYVGKSQSGADEEESGGGPSVATLPDKFESIAQYKSLWAPLALREAKSQTLSEISASVSDGGVGLEPMFVKVQRIGGDDSEVHSECISVIVHEISGGAAATATATTAATAAHSVSRGGGRGAGSSGSVVFENETILLVKERSILEQAAKGKLAAESFAPSSSVRWGLVGTAASRNKAIDGLTIKVSRRRWSSSGAPEMYLYRIGSNITALREFTALCRADSIQLAGYLLGQEIPHRNTHPSESTPDPLSERGGRNSLPAGFRIFVKANYNASQLRAISAAAREYGSGGFTLVKGPPGTGKTTTLVALLNSLHLRQYQRYYAEIENITAVGNSSGMHESLAAIYAAAKTKPRILVCAPSNAAVDNIIAKIIQVQFVDGVGQKYRPSIVRVGAGQSSSVWKVALQAKRDAILAVGNDPSKLEEIIADSRRRLKAYQREVQKLQRRVKALANAAPHTLSNDWEVRIDEGTFDRSGKVVFINHKTKSATYEIPPPPHPGETLLPMKEMPHYRNNVDNLCRYVEKHNEASSQLEQYVLVQNAYANLSGRNYNQEISQLHSMLEANILDSEHIVCTTLGSAGSKAMENIAKFEVVVVDEAAQCSEPATLVGLQLGSSHALLVGDPQQLPATIFSLSGRSTKYDRSLFQRLEEAGHEVHMLDTQYRMHPAISSFPRKIFYDNCLLDGPNVRNPTYGGILSAVVLRNFPFFQHFTIFDLDSSEERGGTSLSNSVEARLAMHLFCSLDSVVGIPPDTSVAIITPYSQQVALLHRTFEAAFGESYSTKVEISTVDAFQGREACIVIFSCVRAAHKGGGIGFLSDVQRMNVALTRAKHFLFVIAHCQTITVNPYWRDLVCHARKQKAVIPVSRCNGNKNQHELFPDLATLAPQHFEDSHGMQVAHRV